MVDFACLFERFNPVKELMAGDPGYVDWQAALGLGDVKTQLLNNVSLSRRFYIHRLFTGLGGSGKSTELRKLQGIMRAGPPGKRYFVSFLDADDAIDIDDANPTDLVVAIVRQLVEDLRQEGITLEFGRRLRDFYESVCNGLRTIPDSGIDLTLGDPLGISEISATLQRRPSIRRQMRQLLEGPLATLYDAINFELLPTVKEELRKRGYDGLVILVDTLDRIPPHGDLPQMVFWEGRGKLKALDCHIVYTAPIEYVYSRAANRLDIEYGTTLGLSLIPVPASDPSVGQRARQLTKKVALERIVGCGSTEGELFGDPATLDELVGISGGHVRSLFQMVRTAIETSDLRAPLSADHVERMIDRLAAIYLDPLEGLDREVVLHVHKTKAKPGGDAELQRFYDLEAYAKASLKKYRPIAALNEDKKVFNGLL